jgi:hypothetical protein
MSLPFNIRAVTDPLREIICFGFFILFTEEQNPRIPMGLMQALPSVILTHVIIGYDHGPYQRGISGFRDSRNHNVCVPLLSYLSKRRNLKGTNDIVTSSNALD